MMLENKQGNWQYENATWTSLPTEATEGSIIDSSGKILQYLDDCIEKAVGLMPKKALLSGEQKWYRKTITDDNYFTLQNSVSKDFLYSTSQTFTTTTGTMKFVNDC